MGEHKNTIIAIVLSLVVMVLWQVFIGIPQMDKQRQQEALKQQELSQVQPGQAKPGQSTAGAPATPEVPGVPNTSPARSQAASREAIIGGTPRVAINTPTLGGSIDLKGGRI